ncbi:MAG: hypothetical protein R6U68_02520 [Desulfobacteraceae bacterium]
MIKILLYKNSREKIGERINTMLQDHFPQLDIIVSDSIQEISSTLCRPLHEISVIILPIASTFELAAFQNLNPIFEKSRVILILPDRDVETLAKAIRIKSSFITYFDNDIKDIALVLEKLMRKSKKGKNNVTIGKNNGPGSQVYYH